MFDAITATAETLVKVNPDVSQGTIDEVFQLTLRRSDERPSLDDEGGVWVAIMHTGTYGLDPNSVHMVQTNEQAVIDSLDAVEAHYTYDRGEICVMVVDEFGMIDEEALGTAKELQEALQDYPLLDEEAYCRATWEEACESIDTAISDEVRDLDSETAQDLEDLDLDAEEILTTAIEQGQLEWYEEECWPRFDAQDIADAIGSAISERREEHALGAVMAATCDKTLALPFEEGDA